jgi:hypothetical protein
MGDPTSEVGYTSATTGKETTKSIRDMWWHWIKKIYALFTVITWKYRHILNWFASETADNSAIVTARGLVFMSCSEV